MLELVGKVKTKNTWSSHFRDPFGYPPMGSFNTSVLCTPLF